MENLSDRYKRRGVVLVGIAASHNAFCLSPFQFKSSALADPALRRVWDIKVIQHPRITSNARGLRVPWLIEQIERHTPELVCLTCDPWSEAVVAEVVPALRTFLTPVEVVCGVLDHMGHDAASVYPLTRAARTVAADYFMAADAEQTFLELLRQLMRGTAVPETIAGLGYRDTTGAVVLTRRSGSSAAPVDLPSPYTTGAVDDEVLTRLGVQASLESRRPGQPSSCARVEQTLRDVRFCVTKGVRDVRFVDADFADDPTHAREVVCALVREQIVAAITCQLTPDAFDDDLAALLSAYARQDPANVVTVGFAVNDQFETLLARARRHGLLPKMTLTIGASPDTAPDVADRLERVLDALCTSDAHLFWFDCVEGDASWPRADLLAMRRRAALAFRLVNRRGWSQRDVRFGVRSYDGDVREAFVAAKARLGASNVAVIDGLLAALPEPIDVEDGWADGRSLEVSRSWLVSTLHAL